MSVDVVRGPKMFAPDAIYWIAGTLHVAYHANQDATQRHIEQDPWGFFFSNHMAKVIPRLLTATSLNCARINVLVAPPIPHEWRTHAARWFLGKFSPVAAPRQQT